jgi:hypothetical protein
VSASDPAEAGAGGDAVAGSEARVAEVFGDARGVLTVRRKCAKLLLSARSKSFKINWLAGEPQVGVWNLTLSARFKNPR